jgi:hypothetical protein
MRGGAMKRLGLRRWAGAVLVTGGGAVVCVALSGCLVAGYSSQGGWWVWPGSVVVTLVLLAVWFLTRR